MRQRLDPEASTMMDDPLALGECEAQIDPTMYHLASAALVTTEGCCGEQPAPCAVIYTRAAAEPQTQLLRGFSVAFAPDRSQVSGVRRITRAHLRMWSVPDSQAEDIVLAISELVTNSVQHGHGDIALRVRYSADDVHVEVSDSNPVPAELRVAGDDDVSGRGLFLIAALSSGWGVSDNGTTTWCTFRMSAVKP
ncbi:ATP-binding protein [Streptomyces sp. NRRL F-5126]|uniref:ATP-binding protein n=1 Tax=Streptomyces sp. NRRL F-5126 TaxID=1463857 RepID=UPI000A6456E4|nr:ATP-binding protein [Streptomyces sp. NRRL F-5126]